MEQPAVNQDSWTLPEGQVLFQWPAQIGTESFEDLKDWMELQLRKIARSIKKPDESEKGR